MTEDRDVMVMRVNKELKKRMENLAEKRKATLTFLASEALERYLDSEEYTFEDFINLVEKIPSLNLHKEMIQKEMNGCPGIICKRIIDIIGDSNNVFVFEEKFETIDKKINSLEKSKPDISGIFLHFSVRENHTNEVNEIMKKIANIFGNKIKSGGIIKQNPEINDKILFFLAYNKKEEKIKNG